MIAGIVTRLESNAKPTVKLVDGAAAYEQVLKNPPQKSKLPAAYVVPQRERASSNKRSTLAVDQRNVVLFGVVLIFNTSGDKHGEEAMADLTAPRKAVRDALVAWTPTGMSDVVTFREGRLLLMGNGLLWWLDTYATEESIRTQGQP